MMGQGRDTIEELRKRRASWAAEIGTTSEWSEIAPQIVRGLDAEIAILSEAVPLTKSIETNMRKLTRRTTIDREKDRIEGDVGLWPRKRREANAPKGGSNDHRD